MELALNFLCPNNEILVHDHAIRRFCPARMELEQQQEQGLSSLPSTWYNWNEYETEGLLEIDQDHSSPSASEVDQFVDSFFNTDHFEDAFHSSEVVPAFRSDHRLEEGNTGSFVGDYDDRYGDLMVDVNMSGQYSPIDCGDRGAVQEEAMPGPLKVLVSHGVDRGLHLVHLLLACAEAVGCRDTRLAESMLGQIWPTVSPFGDSLERVAYCFVAGLKSRLSHLQIIGNYASGTIASHAGGALLADSNSTVFSREEKMEAFQLLHQATPYIGFGFLAANEAICEASQGHDHIHIVDLGMDHALQWPLLFRAMASSPSGPPRLIRITAVMNGSKARDRVGLSHVESAMNALADEAKSAGIHLEFRVIADPLSPSLFSRESLDLRDGEVLFVNSIMKLHQYVKESRGMLKSILQAIRRLGPALLTVVEQDANHNGPFFLGRFLESLHYYSAIFDSLDASLPRGSPQRLRIERVHYAEEIRNIVACEGAERVERHERADQWRRQLGRAGFQVSGLRCMSRAKMMVSVYGCDGYTLSCEKGCLLLGWKARPIMVASAWQVPPTANSHASTSSS